MFKAILLEEAQGSITAAVRELDEKLLPEGDVTVSVEYSSLNYKDGMIINGLGKLVRNYPHVPGIDMVGRVCESHHEKFSVGDHVLLTGWRFGEIRWGGFAQKARVNGDCLLPLPDGLDAKRAMGIGTAGLTAMLALMSLEDHGLRPNSGKVLVTGAAGGVGSVAIALLKALGYAVAASTGRSETHPYLESLGATTILERKVLSEPVKRPLESATWAACIDSVGGSTLARVLAQMAYGGSVAAVGVAAGPNLETSVIPFLLRSINLLGIDSVMCPMPRRQLAWQRLAKELPRSKLDSITVDVSLNDLVNYARDILNGGVRGRVVVDVNG